MADIHERDTLVRLANLMASEKYSDLTIMCEGREFKVHEAIVCPASTVIASACDLAMREGKTGVIEHDFFDADTVGHMVSYIYTQDYEVAIGAADKAATPLNEGKTQTANDSGDSDSAAGPDELDQIKECLLHTRVFAIGDYYDLPNLKLLASQRFGGLAAK